MLVGRIYADVHNHSQVICKLGDFRSGFNIPRHAPPVSRRSQDASVIEGAASWPANVWKLLPVRIFHCLAQPLLAPDLKTLILKVGNVRSGFNLTRRQSNVIPSMSLWGWQLYRWSLKAP